MSASARSCCPSRSMSWSGWYLRNSSISAILRSVIGVVTPFRWLVVLLLEGNAPVTFSVNHRPDSTGFYTLPGTLTTARALASGRGLQVLSGAADNNRISAARVEGHKVINQLPVRGGRGGWTGDTETQSSWGWRPSWSRFLRRRSWPNPAAPCTSTHPCSWTPWTRWSNNLSGFILV